MATFKTSGVIIKKSDFNEADRILTVFTQDLGKVKVVAKGVRRVNSRRGGNLDLFNHASIFVSKGRHLGIVTEASVINSYYEVKKDLKLIAFCYYLCELVDSLCPEEQPMPFVFNLLNKAIENLPSGGNVQVWDFESQLLTHLGFLESNGKHRRLRSYIEEILERELKSPRICHSLLFVK